MFSVKAPQAGMVGRERRATVLGMWIVVSAAACAPLSDHSRNAPSAVTGAPLAGLGALATGVTIAADRARTRAVMDSLYAAAASHCEPSMCEAVARGEVLLGMTEGQLYAATHSLPAAWSARRAAAGATFVPASLLASPRDRRGDVAFVQLVDGRVAALGYHDATRLRVVSRERGSTERERSAAQALLREGEVLARAGDASAALERFDRAVALLPDDAEANWHVARVLDAQDRPAEALVRYRLFAQDVTGHEAAAGDSLAFARVRIAALERVVR